MSLAFTSFALGPLVLKNRLVMAPMQQYRGTPEGFATAYHEFHYGRCAEGGVGLVIVESTAVSPEGRLFKDDIGIFSDAHVAPLARTVDAVHAHGTPIFLQLSHGGRKSKSFGGVPPIAPSALAFDETYGVPREMSAGDIARVVADFATAAGRARRAGFDGVELHAAHGYLLHQFLSPLSNLRSDDHGGSLSGRVRIVGEVLAAVRAEVGSSYPITMRISASDYVGGGLTPEIVADALSLLPPFGLDAVHVSSGGLLPVRPESVHPGYQLGYAREIRQRLSLPVIAVGGLHRRSLIEEVLATGQADLVAIGRPILERPDFMTDSLATAIFES